MQCKPITYSKGNCSQPRGISHSKPLANSSRNKASVVNKETKLPLLNTSNMQHYISSILDTGTYKTVIVFTDGSAQSNPGSIGSCAIIKEQGQNSTPIK